MHRRLPRPLHAPVTVLCAAALAGMLASPAATQAQSPFPAPGTGPATRARPHVLQGGLADLAARATRGFHVAAQARAEGALVRGSDVAVSLDVDPAIATTAAAALPGLGARVTGRHGGVLTAYVPESSLARLAALPGLRRATPVRPVVPAASALAGASIQGATTWARAGITGAAIKVGIIDVGFEGAPADAGAALPAASSIRQRCYSDTGVFTSDLATCDAITPHGTAVAETVLAAAPDVELYLSNAAAWAPSDILDTISWMTSNGVRIINASWTDSAFEGPGDGTSPWSDSSYAMVDQAVAGGAIWVNAAGNEARGGWTGAWKENANRFLVFSGTDDANRIELHAGDTISATIRWTDPWGHAADDYDLALYGPATAAPDRLTPLATSDDIQDGASGSYPTEALYRQIDRDGTYELAIRRRSGKAVSRMQLLVSVSSDSRLQYGQVAGTLLPPADSRNAGMLSVGAVDVAAPGRIEGYSSRGPTTDGRAKPDLVATDCTDTTVDWGGTTVFCGTSQASPFAAGAAALVLAAQPGLAPADVAAFLRRRAVAIGSPVPNSTYGAGRLDLGLPSSGIRLAFAAQPGGVPAGLALSPQPSVELQFADGSGVTAGTAARAPVTLALGPGAPAGASLSCDGGLTRAASGGVAAFTGCRVNMPGTFTLAASADPDAAVSSGPFTTTAATTVPSATLTASAGAIPWGTGIALRAQLAVPAAGPSAAGRAITFEASRDGVTWAAIPGGATTDVHGLATLAYRPASNLWYRASFAAATDLLASPASLPVRVVVRQTAALRPDNRGHVRAVSRGTAVSFTTTIRPSRSDLPASSARYEVYRLVSGRWTLFRSALVKAGPAGVAPLRWTFSTRGSWYVRSAAVPTPLNANSVWSPIQRYDVR